MVAFVLGERHLTIKFGARGGQPGENNLLAQWGRNLNKQIFKSLNTQRVGGGGVAQGWRGC